MKIVLTLEDPLKRSQGPPGWDRTLKTAAGANAPFPGTSLWDLPEVRNALVGAGRSPGGDDGDRGEGLRKGPPTTRLWGDRG